MKFLKGFEKTAGPIGKQIKDKVVRSAAAQKILKARKLGGGSIVIPADGDKRIQALVPNRGAITRLWRTE